MKIIKHTDSDFSLLLEAVVNRGNLDLVTHDSSVREILEQVKQDGDTALLKYTNRFDQHNLLLGKIEVTPEEIDEAHSQVSDEEIVVLQSAAKNICNFHEKQLQQSWEYEKDGILIGQNQRPLAKVGIYVPGGKASYPSTVMMNTIPAKVAGVKKIIMACPMNDVKNHSLAIVAADLCGVDVIYRMGGAHAIAALAYGTRYVPKVDKIVGPGNDYVISAKKQL